MEGTRVLGVAGSLRKGSYNAAALRAAIRLAPPGLAIDVFDRLRDIPPYDEDLKQQGFPPAANEFREAIRGSDAVLIVTPEYNYSVPGVLKNAIDWASRPPDQPFDGKPVAIMGASPGRLGTARAQYHLRQSFVFLNGLVMLRPEVMIGGAAEKFDEEGNLTDRQTAEVIGKFLSALVEWVAFIRRGRGVA